MTLGSRIGRLSLAGVATMAVAILLAPFAAAHMPDPPLGGALFEQEQRVGYRWRSGQVPPPWMKLAINAGAQDSNESRRSAAAVFSYDAAGRSLIAYDEPTGCGAVGAACANRSGAPESFTMAFRRQGYPFDWGTLRWCQAYDSAPNGCYDAETVALHEFGHALNLGHHQLLADESDFRDTVMAPIVRSKPRAGYDVRRYGPCDLATLQRRYDIPSSTTTIALCQSLDTTLTLTANDQSVGYRDPVTFTVGLRITDVAVAGELGNNHLSSRAVTLQRRIVGTTAWQHVAYLAPGPNGVGYVSTQTVTTSSEWRAVFLEPDDEGLQGAASNVLIVNVGGCTLQPCPTGAGDRR
jgi:hypothetical protein